MTVSDGPDPGVTFDVKALTVSVNRDTRTFSATVDPHAPLPAVPPDYQSHDLVLWAATNPLGADPSSCTLGSPEAVGDTYLSVKLTFAGVQAVRNVKFRGEFTDTPLTCRRTVLG